MYNQLFDRVSGTHERNSDFSAVHHPLTYLIDPAIASATLLILPCSLILCFSPGLRPSVDVDVDDDLDVDSEALLGEKTFSLSSLALDEVEDAVMVDAASEVDDDRWFSLRMAGCLFCCRDCRRACMRTDILMKMILIDLVAVTDE